MASRKRTVLELTKSGQVKLERQELLQNTTTWRMSVLPASEAKWWANPQERRIGQVQQLLSTIQKYLRTEQPGDVPPQRCSVCGDYIDQLPREMFVNMVKLVAGLTHEPCLQCKQKVSYAGTGLCPGCMGDYDAPSTEEAEKVFPSLY